MSPGVADETRTGLVLVFRFSQVLRPSRIRLIQGVSMIKPWVICVRATRLSPRAGRCTRAFSPKRRRPSRLNRERPPMAVVNEEVVVILRGPSKLALNADGEVVHAEAWHAAEHFACSRANDGRAPASCSASLRRSMPATDVRSFRIGVPQAELIELQDRLARTRWPASSRVWAGAAASHSPTFRSSPTTGAPVMTGAPGNHAQCLPAVHHRDRWRILAPSACPVARARCVAAHPLPRLAGVHRRVPEECHWAAQRSTPAAALHGWSGVRSVQSASEAEIPLPGAPRTKRAPPSDTSDPYWPLLPPLEPPLSPLAERANANTFHSIGQPSGPKLPIPSVVKDQLSTSN
jgi:hypothetical protein